MRRAPAQHAARLADAGRATPYLVFGHTHVPALEPLGTGGAHYVNTGTWSAWVRGDDAALGFPYVTVDGRQSPPRAELRRWRP